MRSLQTTGVVMAILTLPCSGMTYAGAWQSAVALPMTVEHDSNPLLLTSDEKAITRTIIAPDYTLVGNFDRDQWKFGLGVNVERSSDTDVVSNREDPRLSFGWQRETEKGGYGLTARYIESSTLSTEVQQTGVTDSTDGTQKLSNIGGNWRSAVTERSSLVDEIDLTHVEYDTASLTNYDELTNRLSWLYQWNERVELFTRFEATRYEPKDDTSTLGSSNSYTPVVGVNYQISERFTGSVYGGMNKVSNSNSGPTGQGGVSLRYTGERVETNAEASRSTIANGENGLVESDELRGNWSYLLDETSRVGVDGSWQKTKGDAPSTFRTYGAFVSRELSPFWLARLSFTYKERERDGLPNADANIIGMTLIYSHPDF
ncbi:hypothetical protein HGP31_12940 [Pseudomonas umsongensis]|uniref:Beta-barrel porin 2 n=2 Tax=Pseudomonas umsongensis TaxID=198618 RepID=A0AAE6ZTQ5_9PSED|nr:hypothetical protein HGP31_12940 [Pseudomonas umsongensis]